MPSWRGRRPPAEATHYVLSQFLGNFPINSEELPRYLLILFGIHEYRSGMGKLSDVYGITGPKAGASKTGARVGSRVERTATPSAKTPAASDQGSKLNVARDAVAKVRSSVRFLMKISPEMNDRLEAERVRRGLRSRAATILDVLERGLK
jgi:hypothetical protein